MSAMRNSPSRRHMHASNWGFSSALLVAFGCGATLFGSLALGYSLSSRSDQPPIMDRASRTEVATTAMPRPAFVGSSRPDAAVAFVPQYSEAMRLVADSDAASASAAPSSPYPAQAGLSH